MMISWNRARDIFGNQECPAEVWEHQFDGFDKEFHELTRTPQSQIDFENLWCYYHDLAHVELQPEVFEYLFPVCLMHWHESLMNNVGCGVGDAEFHFAVYSGNVFHKLMSPIQRKGVFSFFKDSFLARLDQERGLSYDGMHTPAYGWMCRFNSLGIVMPRIDMLWTSWWEIATPGRAVAAIQYVSGLVYPLGENPLFPAWTPEQGGGDPPLLGHDSHVVDVGWMTENTTFLNQALTRESIENTVERAVKLLVGQPEYPNAMQLLRDLSRYRIILEARVSELPHLLSKMHEEPLWHT